MITGYGNRIVALVTENGGQTSALNAGFARSTGDVLLFLDADDFLLPTAMKKAIDLIRDPEVVHVHWHLLEVDEESKPTGKRIPAISFPQGNLRDAVISRGPDGLVWSPTSGNAWRRSFLAKHFPLPSIEKKCGTGSASADARLSVLAPLYGQVERIAEPQGCYRTHGNNDYAIMSFARKLSFDLVILDELCELLAAHCSSLGIAFDREAIKQNSWLFQLKQAITEMRNVIPEGSCVILVDDETLGIDRSTGIQLIPFMERDGKYAGPPP